MSLFVDRTSRLRTCWRFALFTCSYVALVLVSSVVLGIVMGVFLLVSKAVSGGDQVGIWMKQHQLAVQVLYSPIIAVTSFILVWLFRRLLDRRNLKSSGLVMPSLSIGKSIPGGVFIGGLLISVSTAILALLGQLSWTGLNFPLMNLILIPALILAAFHEEIVFRGYYLQNMVDIGRPISGVILSSFLFVLIHSLNPGVWSSPINLINLFLAGVLLSLTYLWSRDIWFPTAVHFSWNFVQGPVFGIAVSGIDMRGWLDFAPTQGSSTTLTGGKFGLEGSILVSMVMLLAVGIYTTFLILRKESAAPEDTSRWVLAEEAPQESQVPQMPPDDSA